MFLLTQNMVERQRLSFHEEYLTSSKVELKDGSGEQYSKYGLGLSAIAIPFYILGKTLSSPLHISPYFSTMFCVSLINPIVTALTCMMLYLFSLKRLMFSIRVSSILSFAYGLSTMAWASTEDFISEPATALFLLCSIYFISDPSPAKRSRYLILSGFFLGLGVFTRLASIITTPFLLVYLTQEWMDTAPRKPKDLFLILIRFGAPLFLFILIIFIYNYIRFQNIFETGYDSQFNSSFWHGLYGLLLSPGKSIFLYNPVTIVGLLGVGLFFKNHFKTALLFLFLALSHVVLYSPWSSWHGGNSWGPRFLLVILPYLVLPAGFVLENFSKKVKWIALSLILLGFAIQLPSVMVNIARYDYHLKATGEHGKMLYSLAYSPILGQPQEVMIVFRNSLDKPFMDQLTSQALSRKSFTGASPEEILGNALAMNAPNFWWYYMHLFGFPFYLTFVPAALLFLLTLFWGQKIYKSNKAC